MVGAAKRQQHAVTERGRWGFRVFLKCLCRWHKGTKNFGIIQVCGGKNFDFIQWHYYILLLVLF